MKEAAKIVQEGSKIITIVTSLLAAFTGLYTSYAGSKAPVEHFTRGVAKELAGRRISVNAIGPGPMDTRTYYVFACDSSSKMLPDPGVLIADGAI